jgi:hypothetical protein
MKRSAREKEKRPLNRKVTSSGHLLTFYLEIFVKDPWFNTSIFFSEYSHPYLSEGNRQLLFR